MSSLVQRDRQTEGLRDAVVPLILCVYKRPVCKEKREVKVSEKKENREGERLVSKNWWREPGAAIIRQLVPLPASPSSALCFPLIRLILTIKIHCFHAEKNSVGCSLTHWLLLF